MPSSGRRSIVQWFTLSTSRVKAPESLSKATNRDGSSRVTSPARADQAATITTAKPMKATKRDDGQRGSRKFINMTSQFSERRPEPAPWARLILLPQY